MSFPYPDRQTSNDELKRDMLYHKIPQEMREPIVDKAWQTGVEAACRLVEAYGAGAPISRIAAQEGLSVRRVDKDNTVAKVRYFSEYYSGRSEIILYVKSIALWAQENGMGQQAAEELVLAHEYFHFLECTQLGLSSKQYTVPTLRLGSLVLARSGIRALSEIGAHGFAHTFYELGKKKLPGGKPQAKPLINHALNQRVFEGTRMAKQIYSGRFFSK